MEDAGAKKEEYGVSMKNCVRVLLIKSPMDICTYEAVMIRTFKP